MVVEASIVCEKMNIGLGIQLTELALSQENVKAAA